MASYSSVDGGGGATHREVETGWKRITSGSRSGESVGHGTFPTQTWVEGGKRRGEARSMRRRASGCVPKE